MIGIVLVLATLGSLVAGAVYGGRTVEAGRAGAAVDNAKLDDAFFRCVDVQAHSVISPHEQVQLEAASFGDYISLLKAVGSWVTFSAGPSDTAVQVSLVDHSGPGGCLGKIVVARERRQDGSVTTLVGKGASVPGNGPVPPTPL